MRARHAATLFAALTHTAYAVADRVWNPLAQHLLHDAARYDAWARSIVAGRTFETGAFPQAPLYPYLMAAVYALAGAHPAAIVALQVTFGVATVALCGRVAAAAFDETAGAWTAWLVALYGVLAFFETKLLPTALVVGLVALFLERAQAADRSDRPAGWLVAGGVLGLLTVSHAASLVLLPLAALWIVLDRPRGPADRALRATLCALAVVAVVSPVAVRNHRAGGGGTLIADNGGITFWHGNNPAAVGVYSTPEGFTGSIVTQREESRRLAERETGRPLDNEDVSRHWFSRGRGFLIETPARAAWLFGRKALLAVASTEQPLEYSPRLDANPLRFVLPIPFAAILALAVVGIAPSLRQRAAQPAVFVCVATLAVLLVFYVASRYRMPMLPGLAVIAGAGGSMLGRRAREGRGRALAGAGFAATAAVSLLWFPLTQRDLAREQDAMSLCDLGTAQRESGQLDDAIASYRRALALAPSYPYAHLDLGKTLSRAGRPTEAEAEMRETIRLAPDLAEARFDLGVLAFEAGRLDEAAACFREAFRLDPANADAGNNLVGTYLRLGRIDDARATVAAMRALSLAVDPPLARATGGSP